MQEQTIPNHIGFIVDGNRRWARQHGLPTYEGHLAGYNALKDVIIECVNQGVKYVSVYVFSTENWKRTEEEVKYLMGMAVKMLETDMDDLIENGIRVRHVGTRGGLSDRVAKAIDSVEERTKHLTRGTVGLCFNYGGRQEIVDAFRACADAGFAADEITQEELTNHLYAPDIPDIDIVVRTSGEQRLSNFMLWRASYSEFMFLEKLWPEMTKDDVSAIIKEYSGRQRRFGGN